ncbi:MAG: 4Fe-4S binding protein [Bacteroidetes bacterium]|nr:4Fe-4S binding protein [Bacteroidota bacterium]
MVIGTRIKDTFGWPSLGLSAASRECKQCRTCSRNCPMSLPVNEMVRSGSMQSTECVLCGTCVDNCPNGAVTYSWKSLNARSRQPRIPA